MAGTPVPHPQQALTFNDVFDEDDVDEPKEAQTIHHIRANSSIMNFKKILGESRRLRHLSEPIGAEQVTEESVLLTLGCYAEQLPTVVKSVS